MPDERTFSQNLSRAFRRHPDIGAGLGAAAAVALPLRAAVDGWGHWGTLMVLLAGGVAGNLAHTAVTHVPGSASPGTPPGRT